MNKIRAGKLAAGDTVGIDSDDGKTVTWGHVDEVASAGPLHVELNFSNATPRRVLRMRALPVANR